MVKLGKFFSHRNISVLNGPLNEKSMKGGGGISNQMWWKEQEQFDFLRKPVKIYK